MTKEAKREFPSEHTTECDGIGDTKDHFTPRTMKCEFCNNNAAYRFSPDLDIKGFGACEEHKVTMQLGYMILMTEGEKAFNSFMRVKRGPKRKTDEPTKK